MYLLLGLLLILVVAGAVFAWQRGRAGTAQQPPELDNSGPPPPDDRPTEWDPRERYDD